jgi:hypothetical protein
VTPAPESPAGGKSLRPNSGLASGPSNPWRLPGSSQTDRSLQPLRTGVSGSSTSTRRIRPETQSIWPNSGWASGPSNSRAIQGENPRPESPGHRAGVSALDVATAAICGDPLHHSTFAKHPTKLLSPKPSTRHQTPIFSSFLGCTSVRYWINLESLQILIARLIYHMLLTNTKIHY